MPLTLLDRAWRRPSRRGADGPLTVGLVNNMPDAALRSTDRQFREVLAEAAGGLPIRLKMFSLPEMPRSERGRHHVAERYDDIAELWQGGIDALIVTGTEPRAPAIADEPYWPALTRLIDWAEANTISAVWSCLAAHAVVQHLDGIARRPLASKLCGVFDAVATAHHPLLAGFPAAWPTPHSRHNELPEATLTARGYRLVSSARGAGADIFLRRGTSLFVLLQGHPEYDAAALLREYRRDVERFLVGERDTYPEMPSGYFDAAATDALLAFRERAGASRDAAVLTDFPIDAARPRLTGAWRHVAARLYANWLHGVARQKAGRQGWRRAFAPTPPLPRLHPLPA